MREVSYTEVSRARHAVKTKRKRTMILILLAIIGFIVIGISVYFHLTQEEVIEETVEGLNVHLQSEWINYDESTQREEFAIKQITNEELEITVESYIKSMSLENKISQLIITTPESLIGISQVVQAGAATRKKIYQDPVGGLIFSDKNFDTIVQIQEMINSILIYNPYPIFIVLDENAAIRVENTNTSLDNINVDMLYKNKNLYISESEEEVELTNLIISTVETENQAIKLLKGEVEMIVIVSDYESFHKEIYNAVITGELSEEEINSKLRVVLEYKLASK